MSKTQNIYFVVDSFGNKLTAIEAGCMVGMSDQTVRGWIKAGSVTLSEIVTKANCLRKYGTSKPPELFKTSKGIMTLMEIALHHPHGVAKPTCLDRLRCRPHDCPSLWYPALNPVKFKKRMEADGLNPKNFTKQYLDKLARKDYIYNEKRIKRVNRGKVCYRKDFRERCTHYDELLEMMYNDILPTICQSVKNDKCPNYNGETINVWRG